MHRFNVSSCKKTFPETKGFLPTTIEHPAYFFDVNVGAKNHNFNIPRVWDLYNIIMIVLQKIKFMQEFTSIINTECSYSSLQAKLLMHNCAHAKTCFCSI